jgi:hypothetical protein
MTSVASSMRRTEQKPAAPRIAMKLTAATTQAQ